MKNDYIAKQKYAEEQKRLDAIKKTTFLIQLKEVMDTEEGKELLKYLLHNMYLFREIFTGNSRTYLLEGKRQVGLLLWRKMKEADPELALKIMKDLGEEDAK